MNKNLDLLNLLVHSWIYERRTLHVMMVSCLLGFNYSGSANCNTGLYRARRFGDRIFTFNWCKKDLDFNQHWKKISL